VFFYRWYRDACFFTDDILLIGESREKSKVGNLEYANTTSTQFGVNRVYKFSEKHRYYLRGENSENIPYHKFNICSA
jgi:hypothetical protein